MTETQTEANPREYYGCVTILVPVWHDMRRGLDLWASNMGRAVGMSKSSAERDRIRAKLSEKDRKFMDSIKVVFPNARLKWIKFNDGEEIGNE
ncbi:MAG: hypothetical protein E4G89_01525 [Methanothrix sp.]|nr:MAG: hypothetical protein E4G89_01525 [Methanothrix sp.]